MRSERLLRGMHKVCSHDLPNQIVALQSLLQMLHLEEVDRLGPDGQEYVRRLQNVSRRTADMARFLREMQRLSTYVARPEELSLSVLAREIQGTLKQQHPRASFSFGWRWAVPAIVGDYRTMFQALVEILVPAADGVWMVHGASETDQNRTRLDFQLASLDSVADNLQIGSESSTLPSGSLATTEKNPSVDQRMEWILAREYLAVSQATLEVSSHDAGANQFTILVPHR